MKSKFLWVIALGTVIFVGAVNLPSSQAQMGRFNSVVPFYTTVGFMGFFDQSNGQIYLYDQKLSECIMITQMESLGTPMKRIK